MIRSSARGGGARRLNSAALASLRFFEAAARLSSFRRAAAELSVTQGAVSHQIKYLEDFLGTKLFFRLPRQIKLTEEGEKFAAVVASALKDLEAGAEAVVAVTRATIGVRLRAGPSFALRWLVPRLGRLYARHPNIKLHVIGAYGYFDPASRDFDIAIELIEAPVPALHAEALMDEYLTPVCSPEYLAQQGSLRTPADLAGCMLLHDGDAWDAASEDVEWRYWLREVGALEIDSNQGQFFTLANMAIEAALAHQGIAMGRLSLVEELLASGRLVAPFPQRIKSPTRYCLVYPKELAGRPGVRAVAEWLRQEAEGVQPSNRADAHGR
ncbi:MAG TPA: LysR substrate-binding domain-containing protein [Steroidobacteraceae bacterium]|nr:LysR substrate-binding domain-containing protein [Steroidobacteraceae bacterium]